MKTNQTNQNIEGLRTNTNRAEKVAELMRTVCAWCDADLGKKVGFGVSHGICEGCKTQMLKEIAQ